MSPQEQDDPLLLLKKISCPAEYGEFPCVEVLQKVCLGNVKTGVVDFLSTANNLGYSIGGWLI